MGMHDDVPDEEITLRHLEELQSSSDPDDQARAEELGEEFLSPVIEAARGAVSQAMEGLQIPRVKLPQALSPNWAEDYRIHEDRLQEKMREVARIRAEREQHQYDAEQAAIDTAALLDALVEVSQAQQTQLGAQRELLQAMVGQTAGLADLARASEAQDNSRWEKSWLAQRIELVAAVLAALLAGVAIWAAFAAARPRS